MWALQWLLLHFAAISQGLFLYTWGDANNDYDSYMAQREAGIGGHLHLLPGWAAPAPAGSTCLYAAGTC